jgi:hypothetical protein
MKEDDQINMIGKTVMNAPASSADKPIVVGVAVDDDAKADRYWKKLQERFPGIRLIKRVKLFKHLDTVLLKLGPPLR